MDLAKPGEIRRHCEPNAYSSFAEYLIDYGSEETRAVGRDCIARRLEGLDEATRKVGEKLVERVDDGDRDVFV